MWSLENVPAYLGGTLCPTLLNCGSGLADDALTVTDEDTLMHVITDTNESDFLNYCASLEQDGFACRFARSNESGLYRQYTKADTLVYTYFTFCDSICRVLSDKSSASLADFEDTDSPSLHLDTTLMQFGLWYDDMVKWTSCDCGMNYVLRLRNNKLIIIDGGEIEQATQTAIGEFMNRIRTMTQTNEGDTIDIALWYCTHPHNDHMDFFVKLLKKYGYCIRLERVLFNFPSGSLLRLNSYVGEMRTFLSEHYPDALYLKPHTGQQIRIDSAVLDVLYTQEDLLCTKREHPGFHGANETSTVLKISFENHSFLLLADADDDVEAIVCARYSKQDLACTFLQAAHHCINKVEGLYASIPCEYVLIPENRYNIHKRFRENLQTICKYNNPDHIILAGDYSVIYHVCDGEMRTEYFPVRGGLYDGT